MGERCSLEIGVTIAVEEEAAPCEGDPAMETNLMLIGWSGFSDGDVGDFVTSDACCSVGEDCDILWPAKPVS